MRMRHSKLLRLLWGFLVFAFAAAARPTDAQARVVEDVDILNTADGYEITIRFLLSIQYQGDATERMGREFVLQMRTINFDTLSEDDVTALRERVVVPLDHAIGIGPEITFDGTTPDRPRLILRFNQEVGLSAKGNPDLRSVLVRIRVKTKEPVAVGIKPVIAGQEGAPQPGEAAALPPEEPSQQAAAAQLAEAFAKEQAAQQQETGGSDFAARMKEARQVLIRGEADKAIELYSNILKTAQGDTQRQAKEFLAVAYERSGQKDRAKQEYEKFLKEYPTGPDAERVGQRLAALVTAEQQPRGPLREKKEGTAAEAASAPKKKGTTQFFGSWSEFYNRDDTHTEGSDLTVSRNDVNSDLDMNLRYRSSDWDMSSRATGGYQADLERGDRSYGRLSALQVDLRDKTRGLYGRVGRQSLSTGGVLGRFDGVHLSSAILPQVKLNGVFGAPVESVRQMAIEDDKKFYGASLDFGQFFRSKISMNTFFIYQESYSMTDREAVGAEFRYFGVNRALFGLIDYDVYYNDVNIVLLNGHYTFPTKTTLNMVLDYRKSPLLMTDNATIGQTGVSDLSDLKIRFEPDQIKQMAEDRTANITSGTFGVIQDLKTDLQFLAEVNVSKQSATGASFGVDRSEASGPDILYTTQLISTSLFMPDDTIIVGENVTATDASNTFSTLLDGRFPVTHSLRLIPRVRMDFRNFKESDNSRFTIRPTMRVDYDVNRMTRFEIEGGVEWINEKETASGPDSTELFVTAGWRLTF